MFTVYVLKNADGKIYIGQTENFAQRFSQHNKKPRRGYKKSEMPFVVVLREIFQSRTDAMRREKALKSGKGREWLKDFLKK